MTSSTESPAAAEVQKLLRFLAQEGRVPLSTALSKINDLRTAKLNSPEAIISKTNGVADLSVIFGGDEKVAKQIFAAAKRVVKPRSKKRAASGDDAGFKVSTSKRARGCSQAAKNGQHDDDDDGELSSAQVVEASLALPRSSLSVQDLRSITIQTNRAPLLLAFAVTVLKYTMPEQPLSSRLSLAQAVVSANSRTKAHRIGIVAGKSAEDEGWGRGQPMARVMGRMIPVMRRRSSGYETASSTGGGGADGDGMDPEGGGEEKEAEADGSQATIRGDGGDDKEIENRQVPLWGLDVEALRKKARSTGPHHLPIHTPQSAHAYLLKSFTIVQPKQDPHTPPNPSDSSSSPTYHTKPISPPPAPSSFSSPPPPPSSPLPSSKQNSTTALSHLLLALDLLFSSWTSNPDSGGAVNDNDNDNHNHNGPDPDLHLDLDSKAWGWYVRIRPEVEQGERGWGQRGRVGLGSILSLMKVP